MRDLNVVMLEGKARDEITAIGRDGHDLEDPKDADYIVFRLYFKTPSNVEESIPVAYGGSQDRKLAVYDLAKQARDSGELIRVTGRVSWSEQDQYFILSSKIEFLNRE